MRLSAKGEYGVRAMIYLALNYGNGPIPLSRIAGGENISRPFLEQIFAILRRGGLINSTRGVKGGYTLASPPEKKYVSGILSGPSMAPLPPWTVFLRKKVQEIAARKLTFAWPGMFGKN